MNVAVSQLIVGCRKCNARLSRYNESNICAGCQKKIDINQKNKLLRMIDEIG